MRYDTVLDQVCEAIGYTRTRILQGWYPGQSVYVPSTVQADHWLATLIGLQGLRLLVAAMPGCRIDIPSQAADRWAERDRRIADQLAAGQALPQIAEAEGITLRRAEQVRAELELRGWLQYQGGARRRGSRWHAPAVPEILGTGEGSAAPPGGSVGA